MQVGADWKLSDKDGDTVLHFACMKEVPLGQHEKTLDFLLSKSPAIALVNAQNSRGDTPLLVAARQGTSESLSLSLSCLTADFYLLRCQYVERMKLLMRHKADISLANHKQELPLHRACTSNSTIEAVLFLVDMTDNINVQDGDGWTPLMYAAKSRSSTVVKYLLQRGADPNMQQVGPCMRLPVLLPSTSTSSSSSSSSSSSLQGTHHSILQLKRIILLCVRCFCSMMRIQ